MTKGFQDIARVLDDDDKDREYLADAQCKERKRKSRDRATVAMSSSSQCASTLGLSLAIRSRMLVRHKCTAENDLKFDSFKLQTPDRGASPHWSHWSSMHGPLACQANLFSRCAELMVAGIVFPGKPTPLARKEERSHAGCRWGRLDHVKMSGITAIAASEG